MRAASSGIVIPGCACTKDSACAARVPLPLRRPALRLVPPRLAGAAGAACAGAAGAALAVRVLELLGRPGPRRPVALRAAGAAGAADLAAAGEDPPTPSSAEAAASSR